MARTTDNAFEDVRRTSEIIAANPAAVEDVKLGEENKEVDHLEIQPDGALRKGGTPNPFSLRNIGLLMQYVAIGVIYASLYAVVYPAFTVYLRMEGYITASIYILIVLPYTLKAFIGIITDCYPIFGYRRRPYMVMGWTICFVCCLVMACIDIGPPYYPDPSWASIGDDALTDDQKAQLNTDAASESTRYVLLMILANLGSVIAFTASDGILVELSQKESEDVRGSTQTMVYVVQDLFKIIGTAIVGFGLNSADYGGDFDRSIGLQGVMGINAFFAFMAIPASWFLITEEKSEPQEFKKYATQFFELLKHRAVYQLLAFRFFYNLFAWVYATSSSPVQSSWAEVEPMTSSVTTILGNFISAAALYSIKRWGLNWDWWWMLIICQVTVVLIDCIPTYLTIWDVFRNQWFWLGVPLVADIPDAIGYIVTTYAALEIIEVGAESATYGLITSVSTLASPFATVVTKAIGNGFTVDYTTIQSDTTFARRQVSFQYLVCYCMNLLALMFLPLLPRQKAAMQALKAKGGKSTGMAWFITIAALLLFIWCVMVNLFSIFDSTSCLKLAGGSGC